MESPREDTGAAITNHATYLEAFVDAVQQRRDQPLLTFLADGTGDGVTWTAADLDRAARRVAGQLRGTVPPGTPVLLMAAPGLEYVAGFYGCLYAGVIAVPAYPPSSLHGRDYMVRLQAVADNAGVTVGLTTDGLIPVVAGFAVGGQPLQWVTICTDGEAPDADQRLAAVRADDVAFLQYTSGSTGDPKGVIVTQGNLVSNARMIGHGYEARSGTVLVSWLPPYHDMGLIGTLTAPLLGVHTVFMPPAAFLRRPARWLQVISRFGADATAGPNFAYEACIEKIKDAELADLDLSTWRIAINGAEPVRAGTIERFAERFGPYGFRASAFRPSYGLAETTLLACAASADGPTILEVDCEAMEEGTLRPATGSVGSRRLVSSGAPALSSRIRIVDLDTDESLPAGRIGEIEVSGPHVARGYWRHPEATAERFSGDAVRTGDLGCLVDGELVVTGRIKDVLIVRGRNYYPQDIELTVEEAHPAFRRGCGVAFTVDRGDGELLVVVQEINPALVGEPGRAVEQVRRAVTAAHAISPARVVLTRPGTVPKTSSGKVRRADTRRLYEQDALEFVWSWPSRDPLEPAGAAAG